MGVNILLASVDQNGVLSFDCSVDPGTTNLRLVLDGQEVPGTIVATIYGWLFRSPDGTWGDPGITWGPHQVAVRYDQTQPATSTSTSQPLTIPHPNSTLAGTQFKIAELLPYLYGAGFTTEASLLPALGVAIAESGLYTQARNWHPESGFRPASDVIGVKGASICWNSQGQQCHSDRGMFQISSQFWSKYTDVQCDTVPSAATATYAISQQGTNFSLWASYATGRVQRYYDQPTSGWPALRPIVDTFLQNPTSKTS